MAAYPPRALAEALLKPCGAFLRCDRGDALYVTNAPLLHPSPDVLLRALETAGFLICTRGRLWTLMPGKRLTEALSAYFSDEEDFLHTVVLDGRPAEASDTALLCRCLKALESPLDRARLDACERAVRQYAAECLRTGRGGGLVSLCSRILARCRAEDASHI